ncbi:MAG TPA: hypothetical protein PLH70_00915 [Bacteroidales bacterium]|nr:hypothetical protein [Bacteroidales bacterium]HOH21857.1 hypothetical protein [Bacteroidales bacterium]HPB57191.1 hypothetical protein [Bacteroidales bacterium]HPZ02753.1 hypothetical protein [Bacteroidales bacterium]HQB74347.1 hypothetical protein [Bacteroidales bacterium]
MTQEVTIKDKQKYLEENYPFEGIPKLTDQLECIHCGSIFTVGDYKVYRRNEGGMEFICCPNAPECNGTVIDWIPTKRRRKK